MFYSPVLKRPIYETELLRYFSDTLLNRTVLEAELSEIASKQAPFEVQLTGPIWKRVRNSQCKKRGGKTNRILYSIDSAIAMALVDELYMRIGTVEKSDSLI